MSKKFHIKESDAAGSAENLVDAMKKHGVVLDFENIRSLERFDKLVLKDLVSLKVTGELSILMYIIPFAFYLGEFVRRTVGGEWKFEKKVLDSHIRIVYSEDVQGKESYIEFNPFAAVTKRMDNSFVSIRRMYEKLVSEVKKADKRAKKYGRRMSRTRIP